MVRGAATGQADRARGILPGAPAAALGRRAGLSKEGMNMKKTLALALAAVVLPVAVMAMPTVGQVVGTNPDDAKAALEAAGCTVDEFEAEDGKIEAKCTEAESGKMWEVYIDPASGAVVEIKGEE